MDVINEHRAKICRGNLSDIDEAIKNGLVNANDIIITKDTHELVYVKTDGSKEIIGNSIRSYESRSEALILINALASTTAGQIVTIKNSEGKYIPYVVQVSGLGFTVEPVTAEVELGGVYWKQI